MDERNIYTTLYEYHKFGYEKYFFSNTLLYIFIGICVIATIAISPYASPIIVALMYLVSVLEKRLAHREGFVDGVTEASNLYATAKNRNSDGELDEDTEEVGLLEEEKFIHELDETIKFLKEK